MNSAYYRRLFRSLNPETIILLYTLDDGAIVLVWNKTKKGKNFIVYCDFTENIMFPLHAARSDRNILDHIPNDMDPEYCRNAVHTFMNRAREMHYRDRLGSCVPIVREYPSQAVDGSPKSNI